MATAPAVMRVAEAATVLRVSQDSVLRYWKQGTLDGRKCRGVVLLLRSSVEALLPHEGPTQTALERIRELLPALGADERRLVAIEALTTTS